MDTPPHYMETPLDVYHALQMPRNSPTKNAHKPQILVKKGIKKPAIRDIQSVAKKIYSRNEI